MAKKTSNKWPKTLDEAVDYLVKEMDSQSKKTVRETAHNALIGRFHMSWGMGIRNSFGLWGGNTELLKSCGQGHPDDASSVIIEAVWKRLQSEISLYEHPNFEQLCTIIGPDFGLINEELMEYFAKHPDEMYQLDPRKYEMLLEAVFRNQGYRTELGPGWSDGGVDLRLFQKDSIGEICTLVQAKRYKPSSPIRLEAVASLVALVEDEKANRGLFVTTSRFLPSTQKFAERQSRRITLATSIDVAKWCEEAARRGFKT